MPTAIATPLAAAVTAHLVAASADGQLTETITPTRANVPLESITGSAQGVVVVVFPGQRSTELQGRSEDERTYEIRVAVWERLSQLGDGADPLTRQDELIALGESVEQALERQRFDLGDVEAVWNSSEAADPIFPSHIETKNQFTTLITIYFTVLL